MGRKKKFKAGGGDTDVVEYIDEALREIAFDKPESETENGWALK